MKHVRYHQARLYSALSACLFHDYLAARGEPADDLIRAASELACIGDDLMEAYGHGFAAACHILGGRAA